MNEHTHTHTHTHIYIYIYIYVSEAKVNKLYDIISKFLSSNRNLSRYLNLVIFAAYLNLSIYPYLPNPSARAGYDTSSNFKRSLSGLNSEFSFSQTSCLTKAEKPSLPYYLPITERRIIGFIPFPRVLVLCETQSASSRI